VLTQSAITNTVFTAALSEAEMPTLLQGTVSRENEITFRNKALQVPTTNYIAKSVLPCLPNFTKTACPVFCSGILPSLCVVELITA